VRFTYGADVRLNRPFALAIPLTLCCTVSACDSAQSVPVDAETLPISTSPGAQLAMDEGASWDVPLLTPQPQSVHPVGGEWREFVAQLESLDEYGLVVLNRWHSAIAVCMAEAGFSFEPSVSPLVSDRDMFRALNPLNRSAALQWGFRLPAFPEPPSARLNSPEYDRALHGSGEGSDGCANETAEVMAPLDEVSESAQELLNQLYSVTDGATYFDTSEGSRILRDWRECMALAGFEAQTRDDLALIFLRQSDRVTSAEVVARLGDLECDASVGLTSSRSAWEREQFAQWEQSTVAAWIEVMSALD
jgi:hypothetical protein